MLELQGMKMVDAVINGYVNLAAIVWFLFVLSPPAALAAVAGTAVSCLALASVNRASQRLTPAAHKATEDLTSDIVEYVRGLGTAKSYGHGGAAERPIRATIQRLKDARIAIELAFTPRNVVHLVAFKLASVGVVACAAWPFARGAMPLWVFLALCACLVHRLLGASSASTTRRTCSGTWATSSIGSRSWRGRSSSTRADATSRSTATTSSSRTSGSRMRGTAAGRRFTT